MLYIKNIYVQFHIKMSSYKWLIKYLDYFRLRAEVSRMKKTWFSNIPRCTPMFTKQTHSILNKAKTKMKNDISIIVYSGTEMLLYMSEK